jgi:cell fate regulator YaaT (PSP1 superfamily)
VTANRQYLIQYGRPGFVGRFASELALARGDRVVVKGPRGLEFGEVLVAPERSATDEDGAVLRIATARDDTSAGRLEMLGHELLVAAGRSALPLSFVDVEVTLDGTAILHALAWDACDATALLDELATRFGIAVRLLDLGRLGSTKDPAGCGKPGCGAESGGCSTCGTGGGCSTGSCSRGSVKSAEDLTAYFAELRHKMEDAGLVRTPLN